MSKGDQSIQAFLKVKMLFLYLCLLGCSLSLSVGDEIEEFQANLENVLKSTEEEIFLPVPSMSKKCICIPEYLNNIVTCLEKLEQKFDDKSEVKATLRMMQSNMKQLIGKLKKGDKVKLSKSCGQREVGRKNVLRRYRQFFESLNDSECIQSQ